MPPTVHVIYAHGARISTPDAIGRKLGEHLARRFPVRLYPFNHPHAIVPAPGDVLLGYPDAAAWSPFKRSLAHPDWGRRLAIAPYTHGDLAQVAFLDRVLPQCDRFLAITGHYWFSTTAGSPCAHWLPRMVHLDLAVERADFPSLARTFNPAGRRRFLYIGHDGWYKNMGYLAALARSLPPGTVAWAGRGKRSWPGLSEVGFHDFATPAGRAVLADFDFLITVGRADANPTTVLEAMAWGLVPVCTPQSGYDDEAGVVNVPLDDLAGALAVLNRLQTTEESELRARQASNSGRLATHFHWERFAEQVAAAIAAADRPALLPRAIANRLRMRWAEVTSPWSFLRFQNFRRALKRRLSG